MSDWSSDVALPICVGTGLVTLGRDERGTDVLIDLSLVDGDVAVNGAPTMAAEVIAALALELCINPWSARIRVTGVGLPRALHELCGRRLERADDLAAALGAPEPMISRKVSIDIVLLT